MARRQASEPPRDLTTMNPRRERTKPLGRLLNANRYLRPINSSSRFWLNQTADWRNYDHRNHRPSHPAKNRNSWETVFIMSNCIGIGVVNEQRTNRTEKL